VYRSNVTVSLTAVDNDSGVAYTMVKVDAFDWMTYDAAFVVSDDGAHTVSFYSVDYSGNAEAEKQVSFTIQHALPLEITVKGGVGVSVQIKNTGSVGYTDVPWSISLQGGLLLKVNQTQGLILSLPAWSSTTKTLPVLGFGRTMVTVTVDVTTVQKKAFVLFFFVLGVS
jgi:hypothetical protein